MHELIRVRHKTGRAGPGDVERDGRARVEQLGDADDEIVGAFLHEGPLEEDLDIVVGAGDAGEERGVFLIKVGECIHRPTRGDVVALAAVAETQGDVDSGKLAGEVGIPRFAAIREFRKGHLIATGRGGLAARSGAGDGVEDALELEVQRGAEALLNIGPLSFDGDATVRFAVVGIFIGDGIFGADVARSEPDEERGEGERAKGRKRRSAHERASGERA